MSKFKSRTIKLSILAIVLVVLFSLVGLTACNNDEEEEPVGNQISFEEGVFGGVFDGLNGDEEFSAIIRNQQELASYFDDYEINWQNYTPIWERYDNNFFESDALLLHFFWATSTDLSFSIDNIRIDGNKLKMFLVGNYYGDTLNDAVQFVPIVTEVAQGDIDNATKLIVDIQHKKL